MSKQPMGTRGRGSFSAGRKKAVPSALLLALVRRARWLWLGWLEAKWAAAWSELRQWRARRSAARIDRPMLEALEPKLLLSAELMPLDQAALVVVERQIDVPAAQTAITAVPTVHPLAVNVTAVAPTVTLTGPGTGQVVADGAGYILQLTGTSSATNVSLVHADSSPVALTGISANGAVGALNLGNADLTGNATFLSSVGSLTLGQVNQASISVAAGTEFSFKAGTVTDTKLAARTANLSVNVTAWASSTAGASRIDAAGLKSLVTTGNLGCDVFLSGLASGYTLTTVQVGGTLAGGLWSVHGRASSITAGSTAAAWRLNISSTLVQLVIKADASGDLALAGLQLLQVGGSARGLHLLVGADLGDDAALGGSGANADTFKAGTLARVRITGDMVDSQFYVSVDPVNGVLGDGDDLQLGTPVQRLQELIVGGALLGSSSVIAPLFPTTVRVGGRDLDPATLPQLAKLPPDRIAPVLASFGLAPASDTGALGDNTTTANPVTLVGQTEAGALITLRASGSSTVLASTTAAANGSFSVAGITLALGSNSFTLRVADAAGNATTASLTVVREAVVVVDTTAPALAAALQSDTGIGAADGITNNPAITGTVTDAVGVTVLQAALDPSAGSGFTSILASVGAGGAFSLNRAQLDSLAGGTLGQGAHTLRLVAKDAAGNTSTVDVAFTLDSQASAVASFGLAAASDTGTAGDLKTTTNPVTLQGLADAGAVLTLRAAGSATVLGSTTAASDGSFSFAGIALVLGDNGFELTATDVAGNTAQSTLTVVREAPVVVDSTAPALAAALQTDTGSSAADGITSDPTITGTVTDAVGVTVLQAALDPTAGSTFTSILASVSAAGAFSLNRAQLDSLAGGTLAQGAHTLRLVAKDAAGNTSTVDVAFTLDSQAPAVVSFGLASESDTDPVGDNQTTLASVTLRGQTEPGAQVRLGNATQTADAQGGFAFSGVALALGSNSFTASITDAAGNTGGASISITRVSSQSVDTTPPTLANLRLDSDSGSSGSDSLTASPAVVGVAGDDTGVTVLRATLDQGANPVWVDVSASLGAGGSLRLGTAQIDALAGGRLADGTHTLRLQAFDAAGNASAEGSVHFTLDRSAPAAASIGVASADALNGNTAQTASALAQLRGTAEAGATVSLPAQGLAVLVGSNGSFQLPGVALALGDNLLQFTATDAAGNSRASTVTITRVAQPQTDAVLVWNNIALRAIQLDVTDPPVATRLLALISLAQYDTLAAIEGSPAFLVQRSVSGAVDARAAAAVAAHRVLSLSYPAQKAIFDAALASALAAVADGAAKDSAIALGLSVADAVWAVRAADGSEDFSTYSGSTTAGQWRPTGPMFDVADNPHWGGLTPFVLTSADQFRPAAPPALDTAAYAAAVNEIKALGSATGSTRSADQTQQALFWADGMGSTTPPGHWNQIAAQVAAAEGNSLSANARLFAQLNVALADAAIACWDAKYFYGAWRPETAIQEAELDNNAATTEDSTWRPLLITPPHPDYVSGHSAFSAAAARILGAAFGDNTAFSTTSATLPGVTRSFTSFSQAADEAGVSRVYGGIHFSYANAAGKALGQQVAAAVQQRFTLTQDTQAPMVVIGASAAAVSTNPSLTGQVLDNLSGVASASYRVDSGAEQALTLDLNGGFSITTALATNGLADGTHTVTISARDAAGNVGTAQRSFTLDTQVPNISLASLAEGGSLLASSRLTGIADGTGSDIVSLHYTLGSGRSARTIAFDRSTGAFDAALTLGDLPVGSHALTIVATDAAGNTTSLARTLTLAALPPLTVTRLTPATGAGEVGVTQRPQVNFSRAVDKATLTTDSFYATGPDGQKLAATIVPSMDGSFAWLFFTGPMPGGATITLHLQGDLVRAANGGALLDADGDGTAGGAFSSSFSTVSSVVMPATTVIDAAGNASVVRTSLVGRVVDPGADLQPMSFDDIRRGADGVIHTADDVFLNPIAHAKVWVLGQENHFVFTDAQGRFELLDVPSGNLKLAIDGRTASNAPDGVFWPEMVMDLTVEAGLPNTVMGSMGSSAEQRANEDRSEVYLPQLQRSMLKDISDTEDTVVTVEAGSAPQLTDAERAQLKLVVQPGSMVDEHGTPVTGTQVGISTVPPELVRDMLPPGVLQHTFDITIQAPGVAAFTTPLQITFPNVFNAKPGEQLNFLSFDHTTGRLVIEGTATVSADGFSVVTDAGQGITKPGWHGLTALGALWDTIVTNILNNDTADLVLAVADIALVVATIAFAAAGVTAAAPVLLFIGTGLLVANVVNLAFDTGVALGKITEGGDLSFNDAVNLASGALGGFGKLASRTGGFVLDAGKPWAEKAFRLFSDDAAQAAGSLGRVLENAGQTWLNTYDILGTASGLNSIFEKIGLSPFAPPAAKEQARQAQAAMNRLIPQVRDAYSPLTDALGDVMRQRLGERLLNPDAAAYIRVEDSQLTVFDNDAKPLKDVTGQRDATFDMADLMDPREVARPDVAQGLKAKIDEAVDRLRAIQDPNQSDVPGLSAEVYQNLMKIYQLVAAQADPVPLSAAAYYRVIDLATQNTVVSGRVSAIGALSVFLGIGTYRVEVYSPESSAMGVQLVQVTAANRTQALGVGRLVQGIQLFQVLSPDTDADGLIDAGEDVIGTRADRFDSDGDGISDRAEVLAGTDPLGGRALPSGVVGATALRGEATAVVLTGNATGGETQTAYVATGSQGLAIVDASQFRTPVVLSQLDLAGNAVDIAIEGSLRIAAVAAGSGGLHLVDVANASAPQVLQTLAINATQVETLEGIAYVATGTELRAYDIATGERLGGVAGSAAIVALARDGDTLYTLDSGRQLRIYQISAGSLVARGSIEIAGSPASLFVGGGLAYIGMDNTRSQGYVTIDVRNPAAPLLISGPDDITIATGALAVNGSGLLISGGEIAAQAGLVNAIEVVNARDAANTGARVTRFVLPQAPRDIAIGGGLAFVAAGTAGLQVINYLGADNKGVAPSVVADLNRLDIDPVTPGIQMLEGSAVSARPVANDDVQVRSVELLRDGQVVTTDTGFPFELGTILPTIAANGGSASVMLQVRATDTGGNVGSTTAVTVTLVPDALAPVLLASNLAEGASKGRSFRTVNLVFSEALNAATVNATTVQLTGPDGQAVPAPQIQFRQLGREVQLTFAPLPQVGVYQLRLSAAAITDRAGNPLGASVQTTHFTLQSYSNEWVGAVGGFWDVASNWSTGVVPAAGDDVFIDLPASASITVRSGTAAVETLTSDARIVLNGGNLSVAGEARLLGGLTATRGTLTLAGNAAIGGGVLVNGGTLAANGALDIDTLHISAGVLDGTGTTTVSGDARWSGGTLQGSGTVTFTAALSIEGDNNKLLLGGRTVNTLGTTIWSGNTGSTTNDFYTGAATINNFGTFVDANAFSTIVRDWYDGVLVFNNSGTYRKTDSGTSSLELTFNNTGLVDLQAGVLSLLRGGSAGAVGELRIDPAATLRLNAGTFNLDSTTVTGTGTFQVAGTFNDSTSVIHTGTTTLAGQLSLVGGTLFANGTLNAATYSQAANYAFVDGTGSINVAGAATWSDGNMLGTGTINFNGDLAITGNAEKVINGGRVLNLRGTTTWSGNTAANANDFYTGAGGINNFGTFVDANAFSTIVRDWYDGLLVFNNNGTYRKTGSGTTSLEAAFNNTGMVDVQAGMLSLNRGGVGTGRFDLASASVLRYNGGSSTLASASIAGGGTLEVAGAFSDSTALLVTGVTSLPGALTLSGGTLTVGDGLSMPGALTLSGGTLLANATVAAASLAMTDSDTVLSGAGTVAIAGDSTWLAGAMTGTGTTTLVGNLVIGGNDAKVINGGRVINLRGTTTWSGNTAVNTNDFYTGAGTINNFGTFIDANAFSTVVRDWFDGVLVFNNNGTYRKTGNTTSSLEATFNNTGTVDLQAGVLSLLRGGMAGALGTLHIEPAATLRFGAGSFNLDSTTVTGTGTFQVAGTFNDSTSVIHTGTTTLAGQLSLVGGTLFANGTLNAPTYSQAANYAFVDGTGSINVAGAATWSDGNVLGTGTINFNGDLAITGNAEKVINGGRVLNLRGTTTWSGNTAVNTNDFYTGAGSINNFGTFVDANAFGTIVRDWYDGLLVFNNSGTYRKTGSGTTSLEAAFNNTGMVDVQAGMLLLARGGSAGAVGLLNIEPTATLRLASGTFNLDSTRITGTGTFQVAGTFNDSTSVIHTGTSTLAGQLSLVGGTLFANGTLNTATYSQAANYAFVDGTGSINVAGAATWSDGNMLGTGTINFNGHLAITGNAEKAINGGRVINLRGTTTWSGNTGVNTNDFYTGPATINNFGTFVDANAFSTIVRDWYGGGALVFNNSGTYRKTGNSTTSLEVNFNNTGTVDVQAGVLSLLRGGTSSGRAQTTTGAELALLAGTHTWTIGAVAAGDGLVSVRALSGSTSGRLDIEGDVSMGRFDLGGDGVLGGTGTLTLTGANNNWTGGTMTGGGSTRIAAGGTLTLSGNQRKFLGTRTLDNRGTLTDASTGDRVDLDGTAVLDNSGLVDVRGNTNWQDFSGAAGTLVLNNSGTLRRSTGSGQFSFLDTALHNTGVVESLSGQLAFGAGVASGTSNGSFVAAAGSEIAFVSGAQIWASGARASGAGAIALRNLSGPIGGTLQVTGNDVTAERLNLSNLGVLGGTGTLTLTGTGSQWTGGTMTGGGSTRIAAGGTLTLSGNQRKFLGTRTLDNRGTLTDASTGDRVDLDGTAVLDNSGLVDVRGNTNWQDFSGAAGTLVLNNSGTLRRSTGSGQFSFLDTALHNTGVVESLSGQLAFGAGVASGTSNGSFVAAAGSEIAFVSGAQIWASGARASGAGAIALRNLSGPIGGTLQVTGNDVTAERLNLSNLGVLGGTGTLTLTGTGSQWTGGTMTGGGSTRIAAGGTLTLSGNQRKFLGTRTLDNRGTLTDASTGDRVDLDGTAVLDNSGLVDVRGNTNWQDFSGAAGTLVLNNSGTLRRSTGSGQFSFLDTALHNTGVVESLSGQLAFGAGVASGTSNGSFVAAAGSEIAFVSGAQIWASGARASGAGAIALRNLSGPIGGTLQVTGNDVTAERLNLSNLGVLGGTGTLTLTGTGSQWTGGMMTGGGTTRMAAGATLTLSGNQRKALGNRTLDNLGTLVDASTGSVLDLDGTAVLNNAGLFDIQGDTAWRHFSGAAGTLALNNSGTLRKSAGVGDFNFLNTSYSGGGLVEVLSGRLLINGVPR